MRRSWETGDRRNFHAGAIHPALGDRINAPAGPTAETPGLGCPGVFEVGF